MRRTLTPTLLLSLTMIFAPGCDAEDGPQGGDACVEACGEQCPARQGQLCGEDGKLYCNTCTMACAGVAQAAARSTCHSPNPNEAACIDECLPGCPVPEEQPCASDGNRYCNVCVINCKNFFVEPDFSLCE